jgi:hypothetical protein
MNIAIMLTANRAKTAIFFNQNGFTRYLQEHNTSVTAQGYTRSEEASNKPEG